MGDIAERLSRRVADRLSRLAPPQLTVQGKLTRMVGLTLEAIGCEAAVGDICRVADSHGTALEAEVVGFADGKLYLMPIGEPRRLLPNATVTPIASRHRVPVGDPLLGRVLGGDGEPLDDKGPLTTRVRRGLHGRVVNPLTRAAVKTPLDVGIRAINGLLCVGSGQRLGLFAGSGVGKSSLLGMMTRFTAADVVVVGLIGERGREVSEFVEECLGEHGLARAVVVAAPADSPPLLRQHGAMFASAVAEHFRDQGLKVLLLMDSLTRYAQAQREIGLAVGEPPATKGYPPSVFAKLAQLVERAGTGAERGGSITAFYTVLTEGDDLQDPIADAARATLDGHIVLSRSLAEAGMFPAIDPLASMSRVMTTLATPEHNALAQRFRESYALYADNRDLINLGLYQPGSDARVDQAIARYPQLRDYLSQGLSERVSFSESVAALGQLTEDRMSEG